MITLARRNFCKTQYRLSLAGLAALVVLSQAAVAGPDFGEGPDAGGLPPTSKTIAASAPRPIGRISGSTSTALLTGAGDRVDMFMVRTGTDVSQFKFVGPTWGARLTLFKQETVLCPTGGQTVIIGRPICTVVKAAVGQSYPVLNGAAAVNGGTAGPPPTLGSYLVANSDYFIAISGSSNRPYCDYSDCGSSNAIDVFYGADGYGQYLAASTYRTGTRVSFWVDPVGESTGAYAMDVTGTFTPPASTCGEAEEVTGNPAERTFDLDYSVVSVSVPGGGVSCASGFEVWGQFYYTWSPQCSGTAEVTTCGLTGADTAIEVFEVNACSGDVCAAADTAPVACNDQCGTGNSSRVTFTADSGTTYLVRLSRLTQYGSPTGTIRFSCSAPSPSADLNGDGIVDGFDLAIVFSRWGTAGN